MVTIGSNNTLVVSATVLASFTVPVYLRVGDHIGWPINNCWFDTTMCNGPVSVTATIPTTTTFHFSLSDTDNEFGQTVVHVTDTPDIVVSQFKIDGCITLNWFLSWISNAKQLVQDAVNDAAQAASQRLAKEFTTPPIMQPIPGVFVRYSVRWRGAVCGATCARHAAL